MHLIPTWMIKVKGWQPQKLAKIWNNWNSHPWLVWVYKCSVFRFLPSRKAQCLKNWGHNMYVCTLVTQFWNSCYSTKQNMERKRSQFMCNQPDAHDVVVHIQPPALPRSWFGDQAVTTASQGYTALAWSQNSVFR